MSNEPDPFANKRKWWDFIARATLRGPDELRERLSVDEPGYRLVAGYSHAHSRDFFLYGVLDEIQKVGVAVSRWLEQLAPQPMITEDDQVTRVIFESVGGEQSLWKRKLVEVLVNLIAFATTNEDAFYKHFLILTDFEELLSTCLDLEEFYTCPNRNLQHSLQSHRQAISQLEAAGLDCGRCWYLKTRAPMRPLAAQPRPGQIFSSLRSRLREVLPHAAPVERLAVGLSYGHVFSRASRDVHFTPTGPTVHKRGVHSIAANLEHCGLLCLSILIRCQRLLGVVPAGLNEQLRRVYDENQEPARILSNLTSRRAQLGDIVLAYGDLGEVIQIAQSPFNYESYQVKYLAERPLPSVQDDWFIPQHVDRLFPKEERLDQLRILEKLGRVRSGTAIDFQQLDPSRQDEAFRLIAVEVWSGGLRDELAR